MSIRKVFLGLDLAAASTMDLACHLIIYSKFSNIFNMRVFLLLSSFSVKVANLFFIFFYWGGGGGGCGFSRHDSAFEVHWSSIYVLG